MPNGLPFSRAALMNRADVLAEPTAQNRPDLVDA